MNPEIKQKWIAALKSGEYQKGRMALRTSIGQGYGHCCLGVLCNIHGKETGKGQWKNDGAYGLIGSNNQDNKAYLPHTVMEWAEINSHTGSFTPDEPDELFLEKQNVSGTLANINDIPTHYEDFDPTFNTVIKYIEKYF